MAAFALLSSGSVAAQQHSPWGLRNIRLIDNWQQTDFEAEFKTSHDPGLVAFWTFWEDFQPNGLAGGFSFTELDKLLGLVDAVDAQPVIVFHPTAIAPALGGGGTNCWGPSNSYCGIGQGPNGHSRPNDMTVVPPLTLDPCPDPYPTVNYSQSLYDVGYAMAEHIANSVTGRIYMRYFNEASSELTLVSGEEGRSLNYFMLSYLSFRRGILDAEAAAIAANKNVNFEVSHGSLPRNRIVARDLYLKGAEGGIDQKIAAWKGMDSMIERNRCGVGAQYPALNGGQPAVINNWEKAVIFGGPTYNANENRWLDAFIAWTACSTNVFDFTNFHPHAKPSVVHEERKIFDAAVTAASGTPPYWIAAEAAFNLPDQENWGYIPTPGSALDTFIAEDLARKWLWMVAETKGFCTPILARNGGVGVQSYRGLYRESAWEETGCNLSNPAEQPVNGPPICGGTVEQCIYSDDEINDAYQFLSTTIGKPTSTPTVLQGPQDSHTQIRIPIQGGLVDAIWYNSLQDSDETLTTVGLCPPYPYQCGQVYDIGGLQIDTIGNMPGLDCVLEDVGQAPLIIVWSCKLPGF